MKSFYTLTLLIVAWVSIGWSQDESKIVSVGILPVTTIPSYGAAFTEHVRQQIASAFTSKSRFTVVDRTRLDDVFKEQDLQMGEEFVDGLIAEQGKNIGAQFLVNSSINQFTSSEVNTPDSGLRKNSNGELVVVSFYRLDLHMTVVINVQAIEVATGAVKSNKRISKSVTWKGTEATRPEVSACIVPTIERLGGPIKAWVNEMFPVEMKIVAVETTDKKGFPKTVLVTGGADMDMQHSSGILSNTSSELEVVEITIVPIDGREVQRPVVIGKVIVERVEGELSVCKVKSGEEAIQKKLNEGKTLYLRILSY